MIGRGHGTHSLALGSAQCAILLLLPPDPARPALAEAAPAANMPRRSSTGNATREHPPAAEMIARAEILPELPRISRRWFKLPSQKQEKVLPPPSQPRHVHAQRRRRLQLHA
jgi:hypothetical protein